MLRLIITLLSAATFSLLQAQSNWELPTAVETDSVAAVSTPAAVSTATKDKKTRVVADEDRPYLAGAVPEQDGKIVYAADIATPSLTAAEAYDKMYRYMTSLAAAQEQTDKSHIAIVDKTNYNIVGTYVERLTLNKRFLQLDITEFGYTMIVSCHDGTTHVSLERLYYVYPTKSGTERMTAEETIADSVLLTKDGTHLRKYNSRFRRATVDRMRALLAACEKALTE